MKRKFSIVTMFAAALIGFSSCNKEQVVSNEVNPGGSATHEVSFNLAGSIGLAPSTSLRAEGDPIDPTPTTDPARQQQAQSKDYEKKISHLYAVVFDNADQYQNLYEVDLNNSTGSVTGKFKVANSGSYKLFLIANPDATLLGNIRGISNTSDLDNLITNVNPAVNQDFVMTSTQLKSFTVSSSGSTSAGTITIQRLAARFDVYSFSSKFRISSVVINNRYKTARINLGYSNTSMSGLSKDDSKIYPASLGTTLLNQIYSYSNFLTGNDSGATTLTIKGQYNNVETKGITVKINKPIKRNTLYNIIITPKDATIDGGTTGGEYKDLVFNIVVNDWDAAIDFTLPDSELYDLSAPTYTVSGTGVTQSGDNIKIGSNGGTITITTLSKSAEADLSGSSLPSDWTLAPQGPSTIDDATGLLKKVYAVTIPSTTSNNSTNLTLKNTLPGGGSKTLVVTKEAAVAPVDNSVPNFTASGDNVTAQGQNPSTVNITKAGGTIHIAATTTSADVNLTINGDAKGFSVTKNTVTSNSGQKTSNFTISVPANAVNEAKTVNFTLTNASQSTSQRSFSVVQEANAPVAPQPADKLKTFENAPEDYPLNYVATDDVGTSSGQWASQTGNTSGFYTWKEAVRACPTGFHLPTVYEMAALVPNSTTAMQYTSSGTLTGQNEAIQIGQNGRLYKFTADYKNDGQGTTYAVRFRSSDNKYLSAFKYVFETSGHLKIYVKFLGSTAAATTLNEISKDTYWDGEQPQFILKASGYKATAGGSVYYTKTQGRYWTATEHQPENGNANCFSFDSYAGKTVNAQKVSAFNIRPFKGSDNPMPYKHPIERVAQYNVGSTAATFAPDNSNNTSGKFSIDPYTTAKSYYSSYYESDASSLFPSQQEVYLHNRAVTDKAPSGFYIPFINEAAAIFPETPNKDGEGTSGLSYAVSKTTNAQEDLRFYYTSLDEDGNYYADYIGTSSAAKVLYAIKAKGNTDAYRTAYKYEYTDNPFGSGSCLKVYYKYLGSANVDVTIDDIATTAYWSEVPVQVILPLGTSYYGWSTYGPGYFKSAEYKGRVSWTTGSTKLRYEATYNHYQCASYINASTFYLQKSRSQYSVYLRPFRK